MYLSPVQHLSTHSYLCLVFGCSSWFFVFCLAACCPFMCVNLWHCISSDNKCSLLLHKYLKMTWPRWCGLRNSYERWKTIKVESSRECSPNCFRTSHSATKQLCQTNCYKNEQYAGELTPSTWSAVTRSDDALWLPYSGPRYWRLRWPNTGIKRSSSAKPGMARDVTSKQPTASHISARQWCNLYRQFCCNLSFT